MKGLILRLLSRWTKDPDIKSLVDDIDSESYTDIDRYRDFRATFGTKEGRRTLATILKWGHIYRTSMAPNTNDVIFSEGERNMALKILAGLTEPVAKPTRRSAK